MLPVVSQENNDRLLNILDGILDTAEERLSPAEEGRGNTSSFSVYNDTGFTAMGMYIRTAAGKNWGDNILTAPLSSGKRIVINFEPSYDINGLYTIRMIDVDGDSYIKHEQELQNGIIIMLGIDDFEWDK